MSSNQTPKRQNAETPKSDAATRVVYVCREALSADVPTHVLVLPWGEVPRHDDDNFFVDAESFALMRAAMARRTTEIVIDYEHASVDPKYRGAATAAPAAGWIKSLEYVDGEGVFAHVEWTLAAAEMIAAKEYRYLSPAIITRRKDNKAIELDSVGLVNRPAIKSMPALNKDVAMDPKFEQARWFLNLEATATEADIMEEFAKFLAQLGQLVSVANGATADQVLTAVRGRLEAGGKLRTTVCGALGVGSDAADDAIVTAINARPKAGGTQDVVPKAQHDALAASHQKLSEQLVAMSKQFEGLAQREAERDGNARIEAALACGKLTPAMLESDGEKNYFCVLSRKGEDWQAWLNAAPVVGVVTGGVLPRGGTGGTPMLPGAGGRQAIINSAKSEYDANARVILCSRQEFINERLREQDQPRLSDDEVKCVA